MEAVFSRQFIGECCGIKAANGCMQVLMMRAALWIFESKIKCCVSVLMVRRSALWRRHIGRWVDVVDKVIKI